MGWPTVVFSPPPSVRMLMPGTAVEPLREAVCEDGTGPGAERIGAWFAQWAQAGLLVIREAGRP